MKKSSWKSHNGLYLYMHIIFFDGELLTVKAVKALINKRCTINEGWHFRKQTTDIAEAKILNVIKSRTMVLRSNMHLWNSAVRTYLIHIRYNSCFHLHLRQKLSHKRVQMNLDTKAPTETKKRELEDFLAYTNMNWICA